VLQAQLSAVFSQHENLRRCEHIRRGVEARLGAGKAVSPPPAGYVRTDKGVWEMDPDPAVREALGLVFDTFRSKRSYYRTVRELRRQGIKVPRRPVGKSVRFVDPTVNTLRMILTNPQYTGAYYYRRRISDSSLGRDRRDTRSYDTEVGVSDEEFAAINLRPSRFHGDWNYVIG